ncbi:MAG: flagellar hook-length control protein FliK [Thermodesulfobacteriota bacterium]
MTETTNMPGLLVSGTGVGKEGKRMAMGLSTGTAQKEATENWMLALSQALQPAAHPGEATNDMFQPIDATRKTNSTEGEPSHGVERKGDRLLCLMAGIAMQPMMAPTEKPIQRKLEEVIGAELTENRAENGSRQPVQDEIEVSPLLSQILINGNQAQEPDLPSGTFPILSRRISADGKEIRSQGSHGDMDLQSLSSNGVSPDKPQNPPITNRVALQAVEKPPITDKLEVRDAEKVPLMKIDPNMDTAVWETSSKAAPTRMMSNNTLESNIADESTADKTKVTSSDPGVVGRPATLMANAAEMQTNRLVQEACIPDVRVFGKPIQVAASSPKTETVNDVDGVNHPSRQAADQGQTNRLVQEAGIPDVRVFGKPIQVAAPSPKIETGNDVDGANHPSRQTADQGQTNRLVQEAGIPDVRVFGKPIQVAASSPKTETVNDVDGVNHPSRQTNDSKYAFLTPDPPSSMNVVKWGNVPREVAQQVLQEPPVENLFSIQPIEPPEDFTPNRRLDDSDLDSFKPYSPLLTGDANVLGSGQKATAEGQADDFEGDAFQPVQTVRSAGKKGTTAEPIDFPAIDATEHSVKSVSSLTGKQVDRISRQVDIDGIRASIANAVLNHTKGATEIRLFLKPEWLGAMTMRIQSEEGKLQIHITTEHPGTRDILEAQAQALRSEMESKGLVIEKIQVDISGSRSDGQVGSGAGQWASHQQRRQDGTYIAYESGEKPVIEKQESSYEIFMEPIPKGRLSAFA